MSRHPHPWAPKKVRLGPFKVSDDYRKPFPGLTPRFGQARYELSSLGRVYRIGDGCLLRPSEDKLQIKLNAGGVYLSLPLAVFRTFGRRRKLKWGMRVWVPPNAPIDEMTGRRSCSVKHVKLVHRGDVARYGQGKMPLSKIRLLSIR